MADVALVVALVFDLAVSALLLALGLFLLTARPAQAAPRILGGSFVLAGLFPLLSAGTKLVSDGVTRLALGRMAEDFLLVGGGLLLAFLAIYPRPARGSERALFAAAFALLAVQVLAWFGARAWIVPPGDEGFRARLAWQLLGPYSTLAGALIQIALLLAYRRARRLPERERLGARVVLATMMLAAWFAPGVPFALLLLQTPPRVLGPIAGDCCGIAPTLWVLAYAILPLGIASYLAWRDRDRLPLAYVGIGLGLAALGALAGLAVAQAGAILSACGILYAIARHGALGLREPPRQVAVALALFIGVGAFLIVHAVAIAADPDNPLLLTLGLVGGLGSGIAAAAVSLPRAQGLLGMLARADATTTRDRLHPYRVVLDQELASGATSDQVREKLRPLRASLGVSDQEHAVLEYVATTRAGAALAATQVVPGRRFLDRYRVLRTLREGGAGVTHLCHDERVGRDVVLKTLRGAADPGALDTLLQEARALARVSHANVVTLLDADRVGDEAFLVMEHVDGGSLADRLATGRLAPDEAAALAEDLLRALGAVHAVGLTHRDVKPSNVLLTREGRAKLADFGIAHIPGFETTAAVAADARVVGTIRYMSPEQARGRPLSARSDLYSAALLIYEAWTGVPYFEPRPGESAVELQMRVASAAGFDRAWDGPERLRGVLERALQPAPAGRYGSAQEMRDALGAAVAA